MSSDLAINAGDFHPNVEDEAYEPTYAEAFPPLRGPEGGESSVAGPSSPKAVVPENPWSSKMSLRSSTVTQVFCVPVEERRFRDLSNEHFGGDMGQQGRICQDIITKTGVAIEVSSSKDMSLTVVLTGKAEGVMKARKMVVQQLQTQAKVQVKIPREHHKFILGPKGKKLGDLELNTATKISIPKPEDNSDFITISGSKEGIEKARHEIQLTSDEQAKLAFERLRIEKIYHPFIQGPENQNVKALSESTGARINIPPLTLMKDEITVSGEKEGVLRAVQTIQQIYEEKKRKCQTVSVEVRKSQHKYVIGPRGTNLSEIMANTGVSVEVPPSDNPSETITLRGEQDKLGPALTMVYSKANSVIIAEVEAPAWLHRYVIGRKGVNVQKITKELPKVHIEFTDGQDRIIVEGPPEEVQQAQIKLDSIIKDLMSRMDYAEIQVDPKWHRHIIGRQGSNVTRIKNETGVSIKIPTDDENSKMIRIEGDPQGVLRAKKELLDMVQKMENEKSRDILIDSRFHRTIIGAQGSNIREIREKFNNVQITFPEAVKKSDVVTLRGPKNDVDKCHKYLTQLHSEMVSNSFQSEVKIFKEIHKNIIGKGGANIKKIRDETDTRIDLPPENSDSDVILITGKKANVEQARQRIEQMQKELANIKEITIEIPHKFHNSIIGAKGRLIRSIMDECGGVIIRFPSEGTNSDKITIRGPTDDVEKARKQLLEVAAERKEASFTEELRAKPEYHKFLIGRGGSNIRKVRDQTGARVVFPTQNDEDQSLITIIGRKDAVAKAREELETLIKSLENIVESELNVDPKYHRHFVARRGEVLRQIADEYGGVTVSFPRSGVKSDKVVLKGAKDCVEGAKKRIMEIVTDLEQQVTIDCVIPQKYHRTVMGAKGYKVQEVTREFDVGIKFPDRPSNNGEVANEEQPTVNGDVNGEGNGEVDHAPRKEDIIVITGKKENCDKAKDALMALVPITIEVPVPFDFHRFIIGLRGRDVRKMMEDCDVNISVPQVDQKSDIIKVTGPPSNVEQAKQALMDRVAQLEQEKEDRELRSFQVEVEVDPKHHPKIIGRRGATITRIRQDHDVQIQLPERGSDREEIITVTGYESNAKAAREEILQIVKELEDMLTIEVELDHRIHPRIIGQRGRQIRKIMDDYKVDIRFPRSPSENQDIVFITGAEDNCYDCKDHLLNMHEEYLQDILDKEVMESYMSKPSSQSDEHQAPANPRGFVVRDAPWSPPDTSSNEDFPEFGSTVGASSRPVKWGPNLKR